MVNDLEINDLCEIYREMDTDGKKKMVLMAKKLLGVQLVGKDQNMSSEYEKGELKANDERLV
jgi:hypothetical protein